MLLLLILAFAAETQDVASLKWMSGCWALERNGARIEEHWSLPVGGLMLGYSRTVRQDKVISSEQIRIESRDGKVAYIPIVGKQGPIPFALSKLTDMEVVFENPQHDYPQRIAYLKTDAGMTARTELLDEAKPRRQTFAYQRVACH